MDRMSAAAVDCRVGQNEFVALILYGYAQDAASESRKAQITWHGYDSDVVLNLERDLEASYMKHWRCS